jgi:CSLREA domain-containing protein
MSHRRLLLSLLACAVALLALAASASAAPFTVTSRDDADDGTCDAPHCSLREAINAANATAAADEIRFNSTDPITPATALPAITSPVFVNASPATRRCISDTAPLHLTGDEADFDGLVLAPGSDGSQICLVTVGGFENGIELHSDDNGVALSRFGTDPSGQISDPNRLAGIEISGSDNLIGGEAGRHRNVISGNRLYGVFVAEGAGNVISGNRIGMDASGASELPNDTGVFVGDEAADTVVGGTASDTGNVISGNEDYGVDAGAGRIVGNRIGVTVGGGAPAPNLEAGVHAFGPVQIGGPAEAERNVISAHEIDVLLDAEATVAGNWIGPAADGSTLADPFPTAFPRVVGVQLNALADGSTIEGNVIGGQQLGVMSEGAVDGVTVADNTIGLDPEGEEQNPTDAGLQLGDGATDAQVSGNTVVATFRGMVLSGDGADVDGNTIGLDATGDAHADISLEPQENTGVVVDLTAQGTTLRDNTIAGLPLGLELREGSEDSVVEDNRVGTDPDGAAARPNRFGVSIGEAAEARIAGNVISGNEDTGVVSDAVTADALIEGNFIGVGADGVKPLGNGTGLELGSETRTVATGVDGFVVRGNRITRNLGDGVAALHTRSGVRIEGNAIFANGEGGSDLGIDLLADGVTANGSEDPQLVSPFPQLTDVDAVSAGTSVQGTISHPAGHQIRIELFASASCDDSGHGQGQTPLGTLTMSAPGGTAAFTMVGDSAPAGQRVITATATDLSTNRTSEFSRCAAFSAEPPPVVETTPPPPPPPPPPGPTTSGGSTAPPIGLPTADDDPPRIRCETRKLVRLTLAKAKKRLRAAGCGVKVTKPKRRRGKGFRLVVKRAKAQSGSVRLTLRYVRVAPTASRITAATAAG